MWPRSKKKKKKNDTWDVSRVCHWCSYHILKSAGNLNSYFTGHKRLVLYSFWPLQVNGHHGTSCFVPCIFKRPATFLFRLSTLRLRYNWIASFTQFFFFGPGWFFLFFCRRAESIIVSIRPAYDISVRPFVPLKILERDCWQQRKRRNKFKNKYNAGADPGEVKWVNFRPLFSEPPSFFFFFSYPSNIEIIFDFSDFSDWGGENSPPISKSWIRACNENTFNGTQFQYLWHKCWSRDK